MAIKDRARPGLGGVWTGNNELDSGGRRSPSVPDCSTGRADCQAARVPIITSAGRCVGVVIGDAFTKSVDASRHFLRNPPAICFDSAALEAAARLGVTRLEVTDRETGRVYTAGLTDLHAHGWQFDRGYGPQVALRLERWAVNGGPAAAPVVAPAQQPATAPGQLSLFGAGL